MWNPHLSHIIRKKRRESRLNRSYWSATTTWFV